MASAGAAPVCDGVGSADVVVESADGRSGVLLPAWLPALCRQRHAPGSRLIVRGADRCQASAIWQRSTYCHLMHHADGNGLLVPPAYIISADMPLAQKKAIAAVRLAAAPIECNTKHGVTYTNRKCQRCGIGVDNEHHLLFEYMTSCGASYKQVQAHGSV
jgi:hypothetical protein